MGRGESAVFGMTRSRVEDPPVGKIGRPLRVRRPGDVDRAAGDVHGSRGGELMDTGPGAGQRKRHHDADRMGQDCSSGSMVRGSGTGVAVLRSPFPVPELKCGDLTSRRYRVIFPLWQRS